MVGPRRLIVGSQIVVALLAASASAAALAAGGDANGPVASPPAAASAPLAAAPAPPAMSAQLLKTGLYLIRGDGSNSLLRLSANGSILVDGQAPGSYRALRSELRKISRISDLPLRVLVVTDHHANHVGNVASFVAHGVTVIAQQNAKARLVRESPAVGAAAIIGFDQAHTVRIGGVQVALLHFGPAQTDGNAVVYFPNLRVVAVGDLFTSGVPELDVAGGGSFVGWSRALEQVLKLDFDVVAPGRGAPVSRADLEVFKAKLDTLAAAGPQVAGMADDQRIAEPASR